MCICSFVPRNIVRKVNKPGRLIRKPRYLPFCSLSQRLGRRSSALKHRAKFHRSLLERLNTELPKGIPAEAVAMLIAYYDANKYDGRERVVLPIAAFDAYFGSTAFCRRYLAQIPATIIQRDTEKHGGCAGLE